MRNTRTFTRVLPLLAALTCSASARAGILIEPFVGYQSAEMTQTITGSRTTPSLDGVYTTKGTGPVYGGRLGYGLLFLVGGVEYQSAKYKPKGGGTSTDLSEINGFLGVRAPFGLRLLGSYTFSNKATELKPDGGYKVLLGYEFLHFLSLNAEYVVRKLGTPTVPPDGVSASAFSHEMKAYQLTISFPFEIL